MAEQLRVSADGELVVLVAEGEAGTCEVRMKQEEAERFQDVLDRAVTLAYAAREAREAKEAMKVKDVEDVEEE